MIELDPALLNDFVTEASEHLEEMENLLLQLSGQPDNRELYNAVFRPVHTIKGASQFMGLASIAELSHKLEDLLDLLRKGELHATSNTVETLIAARDRIALLVAELAADQTTTCPVDDLVAQLQQAITGETVTDAPVETNIISTDAESADESLPAAETYDEDYDRELFTIFTRQLQDKLAAIESLINQQDSPEQIAIALEQCLEHISSLKAAANYMGYSQLVWLYQSWEETIQQAQQAVLLGETTSLDFMAAYRDQIVALFPAATTPDTPAPEIQAAQPTEVVQESHPVTPVSDSPPATLESALATANRAAAELWQGADSTANTDHSVLDQLLSLGRGVADLAPDEPAPISNEPPAPAVTNSASPPVETAPNTAAGERVYKKSVRVDASKIDSLMNQVGELNVDRSYFVQLFNEMRSLQQHLKESAGLDQKELKLVRTFTYRLGEAIVSLSRIANELQESVMKVRMLPIAQLFNRYPRLIHDLTRDIDKQVRLEIRGEDTELDRMIIEEIADPLIHIIRNAVDHGFETTAERRQANKPETGTLVLEAYHESNHIVIEITDDGRGLNPQRLKAKALERGLFNQEELDRLPLKDLYRLIMTPGFSTATAVTGTSGRGVGMDVVKKNVEKLNGTIEIDSVPGSHTRIRLRIPLTLAIISALMVRIGQNYFTIPLTTVEETLRIFDHETATIEGIEVIHLRGKTLPLVRLANLFGIKPERRDDHKSFVVIVNAGSQQLGLIVDELLGQEDVVIKPMVDYLQEHSGFSGVTIIGDGRISLILDVYELLNMSRTRQIAERYARHDHLNAPLAPIAAVPPLVPVAITALGTA